MKIACQKCGRALDENSYYTYQDGTKTELCKKCLTMHVDNFDPSTFTWLLEKLDVPYVEEEWNILRDKQYNADPRKVGGSSVFGKYLSKMKLRQWKDFRWADSKKLQEEYKKKQELKNSELSVRREKLKQLYEEGQYSEEEYKTIDAQIQKEEERNNAAPADIKKQYQEGKISKAEFQTFYPTSLQKEDSDREMFDRYAAGVPDEVQQPNKSAAIARLEEGFLTEEEVHDPTEAALTEDDKILLAVKWGRLYKPSQWLALEKKYAEMRSSFDIQDSDTDSTLILICKTFLKMNEAIDCGDMDGYQKLSRVYDSLRKSAKFTAAQNKEKKEEFLNSVGMLVAYCEKNGGEIPRYRHPVDYDIVDTVITDMKQYTRDLIKDDTSLSRQIEDYLQKRVNSEEIRKDKEAAEKYTDGAVELNDSDYVEAESPEPELEQTEEEIKEERIKNNLKLRQTLREERQDNLYELKEKKADTKLKLTKSFREPEPQKLDEAIRKEEAQYYMKVVQEEIEKRKQNEEMRSAILKTGGVPREKRLEREERRIIGKFNKEKIW